LLPGLSKSQIDRLGDRMRSAVLSPEDVRLLDEYRHSFSEASELVVRSIREQLQLEPTARPAKSTVSLAEKLCRESIRLSQIQDIAGCRVIVSDSLQQDRVVAALIRLPPLRGSSCHRQGRQEGEHEEGLDELLQQTTRLKERLATSIRNLTLILETKRKRE
jgi:hypothetical protein